MRYKPQENTGRYLITVQGKLNFDESHQAGLWPAACYLLPAVFKVTPVKYKKL